MKFLCFRNTADCLFAIFVSVKKVQSNKRWNPSIYIFCQVNHSFSAYWQSQERIEQHWISKFVAHWKSTIWNVVFVFVFVDDDDDARFAHCKKTFAACPRAIITLHFTASVATNTFTTTKAKRCASLAEVIVAVFTSSFSLHTADC